MSQTHNSITSYLSAAANQYGQTTAVYIQTRNKLSFKYAYQPYTFQYLEEQSTAIASGLLAAGIPPGSKTAFLIRPSIEMITIAYGLLKAGIIPVMIDPGLGQKRFGQCIREAQPEVFIGIPLAQLARCCLRWGKDSIQINITAGSRAWPGLHLKDIIRSGQSSTHKITSLQATDTAAIIFTSGSTGAPKGVVYQHQHFVGQIQALQRLYGLAPGEIDLPTFPLFALFDPALGVTAVIPDMDPTQPAKANPKKLINAINHLQCSNMFGSPALLNTLGRHLQQHDLKLPSLNRVISAGAPVQHAIMQRIKSALKPGANIHTPYGATECLPVSNVDSDTLLEPNIFQHSSKGAGTCIGSPVEKNSVSIIAISDHAIPQWHDNLRLPTGQIGEITVKNATTTEHYYNKSTATALAKIYGEHHEVYHRMGDLGYFDDHGRLWFCGRKAHRVCTKDKTYYSVQCEMIFNAHPEVYRSALIQLKHDNDAIPAVCIELEKTCGKKNWQKIQAELQKIAKKNHQTHCINLFYHHNSFPVDIRHNAKINRNKLSQWAQQQGAP